MTLQIEISDDILRELEGRAAQAGMSAGEFAARIVHTHITGRERPAIIATGAAAPSWLNGEAIAEAMTEADPSITLEMVRQELSSIQGSMSDVIRSERDRE